MTEDDKIAAAEADRLRNDPAFQNAVRMARKRAVDGLIVADATNVAEIIKWQADIRAIDLLCTSLANIIFQGTPQTKNPVV